LLCACALAATVATTAAAELERFEFTETHMGVPFKLVLYAPDAAAANRAAQAAFARVEELNQIMSDYLAQSELSRLSRSSPTTEPVPVSEDLWRVLERSQQLAIESGGAFDITVGPYVKLWRRSRRNSELPSPERLAEARRAVGYQFLKLDAEHRTAQLLRPNMKLDLGGIAIGYAVDEVLGLLRKQGITRVLLDASGDIGAGDPPPGAKGWRVGIAPLAAAKTPSRFLILANGALSTAGDAYQFIEIGGRRYSHIVDPKTGLGLTDRSGVAIVAKDCFTADGLDTAVSALGPEAGLKLVEKTPGAAAWILRATEGKPEEFESARWKELPFEEVPASTR
jgi:thiamine biosynthesis lipoprotein